MDKLKIDKKGYVTFYAAAEYNGKLYIADRDNRGLLEYDLTTRETIIKNVFMAENYMNNYWSAFTYKNEIWFVPLRDYQQFAIYNTDTNCVEYMAFPRSEHMCEYMPFVDSYVVGDIAYLIPAFYDCILCIDLISKTSERIDIGVGKYSELGYSIYKSSCRDGDKIYLCPFNNSEFKCFDIRTHKVENVQLQIPSKVYSGIFVIDGTFYLVPEKISNGITRYIIAENREEKIYPEDVNMCSTPLYECCFMIDKTIYGLPKNGNYMFIFDSKKGFIEIKQFSEEDRKLSFYKARVVNENKCLVVSETGSTPCLLWNKDDYEIIDLNLQSDYFIKEILMEIEERNRK